GVTAVEVVRTEFVEVDGGVNQQVVGDHEDRMRDRARRAFLPAAGGQAAVLRAQVGPPGAGGGVGRLDQDPPEGAIPLAGLAAQPFAAALLVAWAQPGPRGEVLSG